MTLKTGEWKMNQNGLEGPLTITTVDQATGLFEGSLAGASFTGIWDETSRTITFPGGGLKASFSARRVLQCPVKMCFGRWPGSFKSPIFPLRYKMVGMQDEPYLAGSPKSPKSCEAGNVIETHEHAGDFKEP